MARQVKKTARLCSSCQRYLVHKNCQTAMEACETISLDGYNRL